MTNAVPELTLYRSFDCPGRHVWSPFVNKLEARLRIAGLPYTVAPGSMRDAPRGKIPYLAVQDQGETELLDDTTLIARRLIDKGLMKDLHSGLTPEQKTQDLGIRALFEDKLAFYQTRERWIDNYHTMREGALFALPYPVRLLVGPLTYRAVSRTLHGQGTGRFTDDEVRRFKTEIWESINDLLVEVTNNADPDAPFWLLGRADPTEADATVFGFLAAGLVCEAALESQKIIRSFPILVEYARRIHVRYFSDYELWDEGDKHRLLASRDA
ncbi:putative glutathione S-transferase [Cercophora newfieldiana]|uniref:Glutathione S-transferase n=1 Tax=Cercophora newfieldiana TaxID=92897 RepID=A0AA39XTP9_9PEZI|nr:putative glutathione S-transferase [Cercophora newfieldiana]